jgi:hypothetical protein
VSTEPPVATTSRHRTCFNCGQPDHIIASCPLPISRSRINAARQTHELLRQEAEVLAGPASDVDSDDDNRPPLAAGGRFWDVFVDCEWRLEMLETHAPGKLSEALKKALLDNGAASESAVCEGAEKQRPADGLALDAEEAGSFIWKGMARWGFPPGWIALEGPSAFLAPGLTLRSSSDRTYPTGV